MDDNIINPPEKYMTYLYFEVDSTNIPVRGGEKKILRTFVCSFVMNVIKKNLPAKGGPITEATP